MACKALHRALERQKKVCDLSRFNCQPDTASCPLNDESQLKDGPDQTVVVCRGLPSNWYEIAQSTIPWKGKPELY